MKFIPMEVSPACLVEMEPRQDDRGFFTRAWCAREFGAEGLPVQWAQANVSFSRERGTLRGMHYQVDPWREAKLIRCTRGAIYDVIIDVRPESPTFGRWVGAELTGDTYRWMYVPEGFAHGFQTLSDDAEVLYFVSQFYHPEAERGLRYDDPRFGIDWPLPVTAISGKDASWRLYDELAGTERGAA